MDIDQQEPEIYFHNESIEFSIPDEQSYINWVLAIAQSEGKELGAINYIFCSDDFLLEVNKEHLNHDFYTDIITFPLQDDPIVSDIFISIDRVRDNAQTLDVAFDKELQRVMAHGILHLCGYGDKTDEEATIMRQKEDGCLGMYG